MSVCCWSLLVVVCFWGQVTNHMLLFCEHLSLYLSVPYAASLLQGSISFCFPTGRDANLTCPHALFKGSFCRVIQVGKHH